MTEQSRQDMLQLTWWLDPVAWALERCQMPGPKWALVSSGLPVAVGGLAIARPGVAQAWLISTPAMAELRRDVLRIARYIVKRTLLAPDVRRWEAHVRASWPEAKRFAEAAGLNLEGFHPAGCADGSPLLSFGLTREDT